MSGSFAVRLTDLRKEKNLSQKEAASCLGISQALLSHYEKGIRECGLDFLKRACDYYDVTSDYLLGLTDSRHGLNDIYSESELPIDSEFRIKTLIRAFVSLTEKLSASADTTENRLREEIAISVYRFALLSVKYGIMEKDWFSIDPDCAQSLSSVTLDMLFSCKQQSDEKAANAYEEEPEYLKTLVAGAENLMRDRYAEILDLDNE
ncbi:MAG: helix-turn-helix domain-containing protein [Clostridiales bacterium]|nr:helix-turn-helix domain-containing protein [Clostridiales bacterium]